MSDWTESTLGDEIELVYGKGLPESQRKPGIVPVFGSNGIVGRHDSKLVEGPGIIVGRKGSVGEVAFSEEPFWAIDTTYYIRPKRNHDWRYLYFLLLSLKDQFKNTHSTVPGLNRETVYPIGCRIAPLIEQEKIASILWKIQQAIEIETDLIRVSRELKAALMKRLFTEGLNGEPQRETDIGLVPASWEVKELREFVSIKSGGTPSRGKPEYWDGGTIPWVKTGEVDYCVINQTSEHITELGMENSAAKLFPKGTLLMAMYGQGVTRAKVALLGIEATTNQACAAIFPTRIVSSVFLHHFLEFQYENIRAMGHGANQKNLNTDIIKAIKCPIPSAKEQAEISRYLDICNSDFRIHEKKKETLESLFQSALAGLMSASIRVTDLDIETTYPESEGVAA